MEIEPCNMTCIDTKLKFVNNEKDMGVILDTNQVKKANKLRDSFEDRSFLNTPSSSKLFVFLFYSHNEYSVTIRYLLLKKTKI